MSTMAYQITSLPIVYSTVNSGADQRKCHRESDKGPVTRKMFPFDNWRHHDSLRRHRLIGIGIPMKIKVWDGRLTYTRKNMFS